MDNNIFDMHQSLHLLDQAQAQMKQLLDPLVRPAAQQQQQDAVKYLHTLAALQEVFKQFATPPAGNTKQQLQQEVQALQSELHRAEHLLSKTDYYVQQWQVKCQEQRSSHEQALTQGISGGGGSIPQQQM